MDSHQCSSPLVRHSETQEQERPFDGAVVYSHAAAARVFALLNNNLSYAKQMNRTASNDPANPSSQNAVERRLLEDFERFSAQYRSEPSDLQYPHHLDCQLTLRAPSNKKIMFYFDYLDIRDASVNNDCNDALYVFAHPNVYAAALEQVGGNSGLCGSTVLKRMFSTTVSYLTLNFRTNDRLPNGLGFRVVVTAFVEADANGVCGASQQDDAAAAAAAAFRCANGWCIDAALRCDGVDNCGDGGDEVDCSVGGPADAETDSFLARFMQLGVSASLVIAIGSILMFVLIVGTVVCLCTRKRPQQAKLGAPASSESAKFVVSHGHVQPLDGVALRQSANSLATASGSASSPHQSAALRRAASEHASSLRNVTNNTLTSSLANGSQPVPVHYPTPGSVHSAPFFYNVNGSPNVSAVTRDPRFAETALTREAEFGDGALLDANRDARFAVPGAAQSSATSSSLTVSATPSMARTAPITLGAVRQQQQQQLAHAFHNNSMNINVAAPSYSATQYFQYCASSRKRPRHRVAANQVPPSVQLTNPNNSVMNAYYAGVQSTMLAVHHPAAFASTPTSSRSAKSRSAFSHSSNTTASQNNAANGNFVSPNMHLISNPSYNQTVAYQNGVLGLGFAQVVKDMIAPKCGTDTDATSSSFSRQVENYDASSSTDDDDYEAHDELLNNNSRNMEMTNMNLTGYMKVNYNQNVFNQFVNSNVDSTS